MLCPSHRNWLVFIIFYRFLGGLAEQAVAILSSRDFQSTHLTLTTIDQACRWTHMNLCSSYGSWVMLPIVSKLNLFIKWPVSQKCIVGIALMLKPYCKIIEQIILQSNFFEVERPYGVDCRHHLKKTKDMIRIKLY